MSYLILSLFLVPTLADHAKSNPVYNYLVQDGLQIGGVRVKFVEPTMADGLSAAKQKEIITKIGGKAFSYDKLLLRTPVAPHITRIDFIDKDALRYRTADFWFVMYGDLEALTDEDLLNRLLDPNSEVSRILERKRVFRLRAELNTYPKFFYYMD